jgi:hypothetical protein
LCRKQYIINKIHFRRTTQKCLRKLPKAHLNAWQQIYWTRTKVNLFYVCFFFR